MRKTCFKCNETLPLDSFYRHEGMTDGHLNKCIECTKRDVSRNYRRKRQRYQEYDRAREQRPARKQMKSLYQRRYRRRNAERVRARTAVRIALQSGSLRRLPCAECGNPETEAHHPDYSQPLAVVWLCFPCHRAHHGQTAMGAG